MVGPWAASNDGDGTWPELGFASDFVENRLARGGLELGLLTEAATSRFIGARGGGSYLDAAERSEVDSELVPNPEVEDDGSGEWVPLSVKR
jgi:hypothetical protein